MLKNYLKIAFRNLAKHKVYSLINIFGLAVGIACCILIALYIHNEWNYDSFHSESDRIYRAWVQETLSDGRRLLNTATPVPLPGALADNIPEVERVTYLFPFNNLVQVPGNPEALNENIIVAGEDFFHIFDFSLLQGEAETVFSNPSSAVLSQATARRFFGNDKPMQKTISVRLGGEFHEFTVTGIIKDAPSNSSLQYRMILPDTNLKYLVSERARTGLTSWFNIFGSTYVLLREGVDASSLDTKFADMMRSILGEEGYNQTQYTIGLQPLTDIHLNPDFPTNLASVSDPVYFYILGAIALLILLIACVNFMTISISKSAQRAREVGVRKTVGALRRHLMYQFWGEAMVMTLLALGVGITLAELFLPSFNELSGTTLQLNLSYRTLAAMGGAVLVISFTAGIYPALILSSFRPVEVLMGRLKLSADKSLFRQTMVVLQFTLSIALITGTFVVRKQLNYVQDKDLGYQKNEVLEIASGFTPGPETPLAEALENSFSRKQLLENELGSVSGITGISASSFTPVETAGWFQLGFKDEQENSHSFHANVVDADFIPTLGIEIVRGRNFSEINSSDRNNALIVNRALVDYFGWENPIGRRLPGPQFNDHEIIGVVENFHYQSLHTPVEPLALAMSSDLLFSGIDNMTLSNSSAPRYSIKLDTEDLETTMAQLREVWKKIAPGTPFDYTFVDQALDRQYRQERRLGRIVTASSGLAIIIACLGLFGLASLMIVRRTKEIGIRKVLGASVSSIVMLVNKEFTKLVAIALLAGAPVAWYLVQYWLQDFAYRVSLRPAVFLLAGGLVLLVAWLTVSYQSYKATTLDPVDSLRSE